MWGCVCKEDKTLGKERVCKVEEEVRLECLEEEGLECVALIEHGFTSAPTQYRLSGRRFLQV